MVNDSRSINHLLKTKVSYCLHPDIRLIKKILPLFELYEFIHILTVDLQNKIVKGYHSRYSSVSLFDRAMIRDTVIYLDILINTKNQIVNTVVFLCGIGSLNSLPHIHLKS
uniref:Uncharacterized protein n=1 Tax=Micrurus corallinus TaxID=54390 RepID=A0A2D4EQX9_MICCO